MFLASCSVFLIDIKRSTSGLGSYKKQFGPAIDVDVDNSAKVELDDNDIDGGCDISGGGGSDGRSEDDSGGGDVDSGDFNVLINGAVGESGSGSDGNGDGNGDGGGGVGGGGGCRTVVAVFGGDGGGGKDDDEDDDANEDDDCA